MKLLKSEKVQLGALFVLGSVILGVLFMGTGLAKSSESTSRVSSISVLNEEPATVKRPAEVPAYQVTSFVVPADRVIPLVGPIFDNAVWAADRIKELNKQSSTTPIYITIDSPGGSVGHGAHLVAAIQSSKAPVYTVCVNFCASMAAIIHAYGTTRMVTANSMLMYHPATGGAIGEIDKIVSRLLTIQRYIAKFEGYIASRVGIDFKSYKGLSANELWLDSGDAVYNKFADKIVSVTIDSPEKVTKFSSGVEIEDKALNSNFFHIEW